MNKEQKTLAILEFLIGIVFVIIAYFVYKNFF